MSLHIAARKSPSRPPHRKRSAPDSRAVPHHRPFPRSFMERSHTRRARSRTQRGRALHRLANPRIVKTWISWLCNKLLRYGSPSIGDATAPRLRRGSIRGVGKILMKQALWNRWGQHFHMAIEIHRHHLLIRKIPDGILGRRAVLGPFDVRARILFVK